MSITKAEELKLRLLKTLAALGFGKVGGNKKLPAFPDLLVTTVPSIRNL